MSLITLNFYAGHEIRLNTATIQVGYKDPELDFTHLRLVDKSLIAVRQSVYEIFNLAADNSLILVTQLTCEITLINLANVLYVYTSLDTGELIVRTVKGELVPVSKLTTYALVAE